MIRSILKLPASWLIVGLICILPLQSFWIRIFQAGGLSGKPAFLLEFWYEPFLLLILLTAGILFLFQRKIQLSWLDILVIASLALGLISFFWSGHSLGDHIIGLRYSMLFQYVYLVSRIAHLEERKIQNTVVFILGVVLLVTVFQIEIWESKGGEVAAAFLQLDITHRVVQIPQLYATLPGPNQLGAYLLLVGIVAFFSKSKWRWWFVGISSVSLLLTFSRSAWLAMLGVVVGYGLIKKKIAWLIPALGSVIAATLVLWLLVNQLYHGISHDLLNHGASDHYHQEALQNAWRMIRQSSLFTILLGHGAGSAGPATFVRGTMFIPESWYLQVLYEYGALGLSLTICLFLVALTTSFRQHKSIPFLASIAMLLDAAFLHPFADNPAATSLLAILISTINTQPMFSSSQMPATSWLGIDAREVCGRPAGKGHFLARILRIWIEQDRFPLVIYIRSDQELPAYLLEGADLKRIKIVKVSAKSIFWHMAVAYRLKKDGVHRFFAGLSYFSSIFNPVPTVSIAYDLAVFQKEGHYTNHPEAQITEPMTLRFAAKRSAAIIAISKSTERDLLKETGISSKKVTVAYGAPLLGAEIKKPLPFEKREKYFFYTGTLEPRKNIKTILSAFAALPPKMGEYRLKLAGKQGWGGEDYQKMAQYLGIADRVDFLGYVSNEELPLLYQKALLFIYPSWYEGFGLPVAEAMAVGTPVITSTTSSLPEVAGPQADLFDPSDYQGMAKAMELLATDSAYYDLQSRREFEFIKIFSWAKTADTAASVIESVKPLPSV